MKNNKIDLALKCILLLAFGFFMPFAFAPFEHIWLIYVGLAILYGILYQSLTRGYHPSGLFLLGLSFGFGWFAGGCSWGYLVLYNHGGAGALLAFWINYLFSAYLGLYIGLASLAFGYLAKPLVNQEKSLNSLALPMYFAHALTLAEWLRGYLFTGFPWLSPGYAHASEKLLSLSEYAPWVGWLGLTWLSAFIAAVIYASLRRKDMIVITKGFSVIAAIYLMALLAGQFTWTTPNGERLTYLLLQDEIPSDDKWQAEYYPLHLQKYRESIGDSNADVIILPETAMNDFADEESVKFINSFVEKGKIFIAGGVRKAVGGLFYNTIRFQEQSHSHDYDKVHLVPLGEYFPWILEPLKPWIDFPGKIMAEGSGENAIVTISASKILPMICLENLFPHEKRPYWKEANVMLVLSDTGWFGNSWITPQFFQVSRMRAIEMQKPLLQVSFTGITAAVDEKGRALETIGWLESGKIKADVVGRFGATPYALYGDWIVISPILLSFIVVAFRRIRCRR